MRLYSPAAVAALTKKYDFKFSKSLGQNFLADQNVINKIIDGAQIQEEDLVIEIGSGMGALTAAAAYRASKVAAIEIDKNLIPVLGETLKEYQNIEIIHADVLKQNFNEIISRQKEYEAQTVKIIGNLPYYITTPILMKILEEKTHAESITVMMQKEVADRIKAEPGTKNCGAISAAISYYCTVSHVLNVPRSVFIPQPNVDSEVIRLTCRETPPVTLVDENTFFACVKAGFGQRRKTLTNSLIGVNGLDKQEISMVLEASGIDGKRRAETLTLCEFAAIANCIYKFSRHDCRINGDER